jgi:hypothetical protein
LQVVDLLSLAQVLDVTALQQTLEEPQPQDKLLVARQASADVHLEVTLLLVEDSLAQGRTALAVTLAAEHSQQAYRITRTLALVDMAVLVAEASQMETL